MESFFLTTFITKVYSGKAGKLGEITICFESLIQNFMSFTRFTIPEIHPFHLHLLHEQQHHHHFHHYRQLCKSITYLIMSGRELKGDGLIANYQHSHNHMRLKVETQSHEIES